MNTKRQNKYNKMIKLSKNNVDKSGIITYNKDTLKNGHQTDATRINRSRSGTRKLVKSKRCFIIYKIRQVRYMKGGDSVGYN